MENKKRTPWNKGLTKDDPRVKKNVENMANTRKQNGSYDTSWNKGLTKNTNEILQETSDKISKSCKGREPWNKGLTYNLSNESRLLANERRLNTRTKNGTLIESKAEQRLYEQLCIVYGRDNVRLKYYDSRYPFNCDFYIVSEDLFIEYNGAWEHGKHPYNVSIDDDLIKQWKNAIESSDDPIKSPYVYALRTFTETDPLKLETFRKNKLNFQIIYPNGLVITK